ncbi:MAG: sigma-70 family RNA polymerase sigma factor [Nocardioidaceae bacterium]
MSSTLPRVDGPADAELISAVRGGDLDAYGELFARHSDAATRLARQLVPAPDADDLVSEAFAKVMTVLQRGGGPDVAFRAYLLTAVRRLHVDRIRATSRLQTTDDMEPFDPGVPFQDTAVSGFENEAAAKAFASLPERWQLVLWHLEVEGQKPADIAPLLGMSANSVSALAYRAREGLRQAFLNQHAQELEDDACQWTHQHLGAYIRNGISRRDAGKVEEHLDECRKCMAIYLELSEVNSNLAGILAPLLLGTAASAYLATAGGLAAKGGLLLLVDRAKDVVLGNLPTAAVAGVAATAVVVGATFVAINHGDKQLTTADNPIGLTTSSGDRTPAPDGPTHHALTKPGKKDDRRAEPPPAPATSAPVVPSSSPADTPSPTHEPTHSQTTDPTSEPTDPETDPSDPTTGPTDEPTDPETDPTDPTTGPTDPTTDATDPSSDPTTTPASTNVAVSAGVEARNEGFVVSADVTGIDAGVTVLMRVTIDGDLSFGSSLGPGCERISGKEATCLMTVEKTSVRWSSAQPSNDTTLTFTLEPDAGVVNEILEDDVATAVVPGRPADRATRR